LLPVLPGLVTRWRLNQSGNCRLPLCSLAGKAKFSIAARVVIAVLFETRRKETNSASACPEGRKTTKSKLASLPVALFQKEVTNNVVFGCSGQKIGFYIQFTI
jgi:hypothetical protein